MSPELTSIVERLGWTLIHSLWQFAIVALLVRLLLRLLRNRSPQASYLAGCAALAAMALVAVLTFGLVDPTDAFPPTTAATGKATLSDAALSPPGTGLANESTAAKRAADVALHTESASPSFVPMVDRLCLAASRWKGAMENMLTPWLNTLIALWLAGVVLLSGRPLVGWLNARRLRRCGLENVAEGVSEAVCRMARQLGISRVVAVRKSSLVDVPTVFGALRPLILLPASALSGLPREQLEAVIAHELAHVRRYDYLVNAAQVVLETVFFYHPAVWWISHQVRIDRENCCDDMALAVSGDRAGYARMLLWLDERRSPAPNWSPALSSAGGSLRSRVQRIVRPLTRDRLPGAGGALIASAATILLLASCVWLSAMAQEKRPDKERAVDSQPEKLLLPEGVNEILGRIVPDMEEQSLIRLLQRFYPNAERGDEDWSGRSGVTEFVLSPQYALTVAQHSKPGEGQTRRVHPSMAVSVKDLNEKRKIKVSYNDWSQAKAWKDVEVVPEKTGDAGQALLPPAVNRILARIQPDMAEADVATIVREVFPEAAISQGPWSGQTGYVKFKLSERYELSIAEYNDPKSFERRFVHRDLIFVIVDRARKLTVTLTLHDSTPERLGTLSGRMLFGGPPPEPKFKDIFAPQTLRDSANGVPPQKIGRIEDESLVVGEDGGLANVFVYLVRKDDGQRPPSREPPAAAEIQIQADRFRPRAVALAPGQALVIRNVGQQANNAHLAGRNNAWNVLIAPSESRRLELKAEPFPMRLQSDVRPWMDAWVLPHESPFAAVTGADGRFRIEGIPEGLWEIRFWHERTGYLHTNTAKQGRLTRRIGADGLDLNQIKVAPAVLDVNQKASPNPPSTDNR